MLITQILITTAISLPKYFKISLHPFQKRRLSQLPIFSVRYPLLWWILLRLHYSCLNYPNNSPSLPPPPPPLYRIIISRISLIINLAINIWILCSPNWLPCTYPLYCELSFPTCRRSTSISNQVEADSRILTFSNYVNSSLSPGPPPLSSSSCREFDSFTPPCIISIYLLLLNIHLIQIILTPSFD